MTTGMFRRRQRQFKRHPLVGTQPPTDYCGWFTWAAAQHRGGLRQSKCLTCGLWRFPQETCDHKTTLTARHNGATTRQILACPNGAHYVWVNERLDYPKRLARDLGRDDLIIVGPSFFNMGRWEGTKFKSIVRDHANDLTPEQSDTVRLLLRSITKVKS